MSPQREAWQSSAGLTALPFSGRDNDPFDWTVQFGELTSRPSLWNLQAYSNRYQIEDIFLSPKYTEWYPHDIALLKLSSPVIYNNFIQPICLLNSTYKFENRTDCWVTGWGAIGEDESEAGYRRVGERGITLFFHISPSPPSPGSLNIFLFPFLTSACKEPVLSFQTATQRCQGGLRGGDLRVPVGWLL